MPLGAVTAGGAAMVAVGAAAAVAARKRAAADGAYAEVPSESADPEADSPEH